MTEPLVNLEDFTPSDSKLLAELLNETFAAANETVTAAANVNPIAVGIPDLDYHKGSFSGAPERGREAFEQLTLTRELEAELLVRVRKAAKEKSGRAQNLQRFSQGADLIAAMVPQIVQAALKL